MQYARAYIRIMNINRERLLSERSSEIDNAHFRTSMTISHTYSSLDLVLIVLSAFREKFPEALIN